MSVVSSKQNGFTIIELVLATAFFSVIMLFVVTGFVQINRSYTRGLTVREVQNSAREATEIIANDLRNVQANQVSVSMPGDDFRLCVGATRYAWSMPNPLNPDTFSTQTYAAPNDTEAITLARTADSAGCNDEVESPRALGSTTEELLDEGLAVQYLSVEQVGASNSYELHLVISTEAILNDADFTQRGIDAQCAIQTGDQFCDVASIRTVVTARN